MIKKEHKLFRLMLLLVLVSTIEIIMVSSAGLDIINNNTAVLCGTQIYDHVNITNSTINICSYTINGTGYWNFSVASYFYLSSDSLINGTEKGYTLGLGEGVLPTGGSAGGLHSCSSCGPNGGGAGSYGDTNGNETARYNFSIGDGAAGGNGGFGGGALRILSPKIEIFGNITINGGLGNSGAVGEAGSCCGSTARGGGGSGGGAGAGAGMIIIDGTQINISKSYINATGGFGGQGGAGGCGGCYCADNCGDKGATGNVGSGGRVNIFYKYLDNSSSLIDVYGGVSGTILYSKTTNISVNLISPTINYTSSSPNITYYCNASIPGFPDTNLTNISLWTSLYGWSRNQTNSVTGIFNQTSFYQFIFKNITWGCEACSDDGLCYFSQNRSLYHTFHSEINLNLSLLGLNLSINISETIEPNNLSYCYFNITRGASLEVANTEIPNCTFGNTTISGYATYTIHIWVNNSLNTASKLDQQFIASDTGGIIIINPPAVTSPSGGGGGSSIPIAEQLTTPISKKLCEATYEPLNSAWKEFINDPSFETFKKLWFAYTDSAFCQAGASLVPVD